LLGGKVVLTVPAPSRTIWTVLPLEAVPVDAAHAHDHALGLANANVPGLALALLNIISRVESRDRVLAVEHLIVDS